MSQVEHPRAEQPFDYLESPQNCFAEIAVATLHTFSARCDAPVFGQDYTYGVTERMDLGWPDDADDAQDEECLALRLVQSPVCEVDSSDMDKLRVSTKYLVALLEYGRVPVNELDLSQPDFVVDEDFNWRSYAVAVIEVGKIATTPDILDANTGKALEGEDLMTATNWVAALQRELQAARYEDLVDELAERAQANEVTHDGEFHPSNFILNPHCDSCGPSGFCMHHQALLS